MPLLPKQTDAELRAAYWNAQAQFGPFEVGPDEWIQSVREMEETKEAALESLRVDYEELKA